MQIMMIKAQMNPVMIEVEHCLKIMKIYTFNLALIPALMEQGDDLFGTRGRNKGTYLPVRESPKSSICSNGRFIHRHRRCLLLLLLQEHNQHIRDHHPRNLLYL